MRQSSVFLTVLILVSLVVTGCGPSADQIATMTAEAWTPTLLPTATHTPTAPPTPSPSPQPPTATPKSTTGLVSGHASWENTDTPVAGVQLIFGEGVTTLGEGIVTDAQGNYSAEVMPGSFYVNLNWPFAGQSDVPCSSLAFTLLGEWVVFPLVQLNAGGYILLAASQKLSVEAGEEVKLDIQFSCQ